MFGYRFVRSDELWSSDSAAWPNFGNGQQIHFTNDDTLAVAVAPNIETNKWLGPIDNSLGLDFCLIEVVTRVESITTVGNPVGDSIPRAAVIGLPRIATDLETDPLLSTHPATQKTYDGDQLHAWMSDGLGLLAAEPQSTPPFFGFIPNTQFSVDLMSRGWPFYGGAIAVGDRQHWVIPIGLLGPDSFSISMFRTLYVSIRSVNPALVGGDPSAMTLSGRVYAHLYEFRERR